MNKAKAAAIIQEQLDRQARESFGVITLPATTGLDLVIATWRAMETRFARAQGADPQPFTLAVMALLHGAVTPDFTADTAVRAYFVRALFQLTRDPNALPQGRLDRELIDATLKAASELAPQWFPPKEPR